jgi:hypothetical protein
MPKGKQAAKGRNLCLKDQQFVITPPSSRRRSLPYTPASSGKSTKGKPQQRYHKLDHDERLECHQAYQTWCKGGKKKADSPIPALKKKYPACNHPSFFSRLANRSYEHGKISPVKQPGRPKTYDEDYDHIIKQVVDAKRALQQCASAKQIQDAMIAAKLKPVPCEDTIRARKTELGVITVAVKFKPQLTHRLMEERKEKAEAIIKVNADEKKLVVSYDETNFHEASEVPLGACYEVFPEDKDSVPVDIQFANADKETTTQHMKLMFGMVSCPMGGVYFKELDYKEWNTKACEFSNWQELLRRVYDENNARPVDL